LCWWCLSGLFARHVEHRQLAGTQHIPRRLGIDRPGVRHLNGCETVTFIALARCESGHDTDRGRPLNADRDSLLAAERNRVGGPFCVTPVIRFDRHALARPGEWPDPENWSTWINPAGSGHVVKLFWVDLEEHEPGIRSLALSSEQAHAWKRRVQILGTGARRKDWMAIAQNVRSFYLDLAAWARDDPSRWATWVAPCPIGNRELRALGPRRRRRQLAEMNARTRSLSPVLPQLVSSVTSQLRRAEHRLREATSAEPEALFTVGTEQWHRSPGQDPRRRQFSAMDVIAIDSSGQRINLTKAEDRAFWTWAIVEVLRHTGIRIEELLELTHLSLRPFVSRTAKSFHCCRSRPVRAMPNECFRSAPNLHTSSRGLCCVDGI
jgi:hypothetical protein